jgi:uncharacterized protein YndB with AHSA1/START domain
MRPSGTPSEPITKDVYIAAPPRIVYSFLTEPAKMAIWFGKDPELDPCPGAIFRMSFDLPDATNVARGAFLEAVPHSKVAFTWGFEPEGDGTRLRLIHRDLAGEQRELHDAGWDHYVARLKIAAEGGELPPDVLADQNIQYR